MTENSEEKQPDRDAGGKFLPGNSIAASGGRPPGKRMTWQTYADRLDYWRGHTIEEIEEIVNDPVRFKRLVERDASIVKQIYNANVLGMTSERELLLDREIGRAVNKGELSGPEGGKIPLDQVVTLKIDTA